MTRAAREAAIVALFALCSLLAFRSSVFAAGIPSYRHDWSWSNLRASQIAPMRFLLSVWNPNGLGAPNVRVINHPAVWLQHVLGFLVEPKVALLLFVLGSTTVFAWGAFRLIRRCGADDTIAAVAAVIATFGPATFDKFVAGHWYYLVGVAALPWAIASAMDVELPSLRAGALRTGAIVALVALQPQVWTLTLVACVAFVLVARVSLRARMAAAAVVAVTGSLLALPSIAGTIFAHSAAFLSGLQTIPAWELNNSAPFSAAPVALGYFARYAETAIDRSSIGAYALFLWLIPFGALVGAFFTRRDAKMLVLAALWLLSLAFVLGLYGPLALPMEWAYRNFLWTSAFRELYHFALPMWLFACVLGAAALARAPQWARVALAFPIAAVVILWLPSDYGGQLFSFDPPQDLRVALEGVANAPGDDRFALLPATNPVGPSQIDGINGLDPDANPLGTHPTANVPIPSGVLSATLMLAERHDPRAPAFLDADGIGITVDQPGVETRPFENAPMAQSAQETLADVARIPGPSFLSVTTQPSDTAFAATSIDEVGDPFSQDFRGGFVLQRDLGASGWSTLAPAQIDGAQTNLFDTWVSAKYWPWLDPQVAFWPDAAITLSSQPLPIPQSAANGWALVFSTDGRLSLNGRNAYVTPRVASWVRLGPGARELRSLGGLAMVVGFSPLRPAAQVERAPGLHFKVPFSYDCLCASGTLQFPARWIVLKQSYDDNWVLRVEGGRILRHVLFSGYGNAWEIARGTGVTTYALRYAPARWWQPLVAASFPAWLLVAIASTMISLRRSAGASSLPFA